MEGQGQLLTIPQVQERLNIGLTKSWELIRTRQIPAIRLGRSVRVSERAVNEYLERNGY